MLARKRILWIDFRLEGRGEMLVDIKCTATNSGMKELQSNQSIAK